MERRRDLRFRDFSYQDLTGADFAGADLTGSNFTGAILRNVDFSGSNGEQVDLTGADLTGALFRVRERFSLPALSADGTFLACQGNGPRLWLWNLDQPAANPPLRLPHHESLLGLSFSTDNRWLAGHFPESLLLWEVHTRTLFSHLRLIDDPAFVPCSRPLPPVFSSDGRLLAIWMRKKTSVGELEPCIRLWDVALQTYGQDLLTEHQVIAFSPQNTLIATGGEELILWQRETGAPIGRWTLGPVRELTFHASGTSLFVLTDTFYHLDIFTGTLLEPHPEPKQLVEPITAMGISPDGMRLVTCSANKHWAPAMVKGGQEPTMDLWMVPEGRHLCAFQGYRAVYSPGKPHLALVVQAATGDARTELRHLQDGRLLFSFPGTFSTFGHDGSWLAITTPGHWQRWSCQTGQLISEFCPDHRFATALLSPDEQFIVLFSGVEKRDSTLVYYGAKGDIYDEEYTGEGRISVYEVESGNVLCPQLSQSHRPFLRGVFHPHSRLLALEIGMKHPTYTIREASQVEVWDLTTDTCLFRTGVLHPQLKAALAFDVCSGVLTYGGEVLEDEKNRIWDANEPGDWRGSPDRSLSHLTIVPPCSSGLTAQRPILRGTLSPNGGLLALEVNADQAWKTRKPLSYEKPWERSRVEIWDLLTGARLARTPVVSCGFEKALCFDPSDGWLKYGDEPLWFSTKMQHRPGDEDVSPHAEHTGLQAEDSSSSHLPRAALWQAITDGEPVCLLRQEQPRLLPPTLAFPVPETIDPRSHDRLVARGLESVQDTWQQVIGRALSNTWDTFSLTEWHRARFNHQLDERRQQSYGQVVASVYNLAYTRGVLLYENGVLVLWRKERDSYQEMHWATRWTNAIITNATGIRRLDRSWMLRLGAKDASTGGTPPSST